LPIKVIARVLKISKNTVKDALASDGPPKYQRPLKGSIVDEVEPRIRELLQAYPMPATVIAERIGWTRSIRVLSARVAELRPDQHGQQRARVGTDHRQHRQQRRLAGLTKPHRQLNLGKPQIALGDLPGRCICRRIP
jgi:transposase